MKQKEWMLIGAVGFVAAIFSFIISGVIFGSPKKHPIIVPEVTPISSNFPTPQNDDNYKTFFNDKALNPTQLIKIGGDSSNTAPFNDTKQ